MTDQPRALANSLLEPPYSQEAEAALLGAVLVNPDVFLTIAAFLRADDFYILRHKYIWEAFMRLNTRDEAIDVLTLAEELQNMGWLNEIGEAYITHLINSTPTSLHAEFYARIVERAAIRRRLMQAADEIKGLAMNEELDIDRVITDAEMRMFNVTDRQLKREFVHLQDAVEIYWNQIEHMMQNPHISLGVPSGFKDLDELLGGFQRSDLVIFAGRPGMGKCASGTSLISTPAGLQQLASLKPSGVHGIADDEGGIYYPLQLPIQTPAGVRQTAYFYESGLRPTLTVTTRTGLILSGTYPHPVLTQTPDGATCWTPLALLKRGDRIAVQPNDSLWWDTVASIENSGLQPCYDLTVPDGHSFVANGIVNHNTSFLLSTAVNAARLGARVAIFTMEMGADQLVQRMIAMETGINMQQLRLGRLNAHEYSRFVEAAGRISRFPIFIDDTPALNPIQMRTKCRRLQHEHGIDMIILDYLQLMNSGGSYENNRVQEVSYISRAIKELAREINAPIISAAQLSRSVEQRQDKRPLLSDLRESGCLAGESPVFLPDEGRTVPIRDLVGKTGFRVMSLNTETWKLEPGVVTNAFATGVKPVYKLTTRLGRSIRATGNHKFLTICGWKRLDELTTDDHIALPLELEAESVTNVAYTGLDTSISAIKTHPVDGDVYWDNITSIEPDGIEEVYDLTVETYHNFVSCNIIIHNSIEQDSDVVLFLYRDSVYNEATEFPNQADVIVAKHRNGPTGTVSMYFDRTLTKFMDAAVRRVDLGDV